MYELMNKMEEKYYLVIPGMDGFYKDANDFTTFADQCRQIEDAIYVNLITVQERFTEDLQHTAFLMPE